MKSCGVAFGDCFFLWMSGTGWNVVGLFVVGGLRLPRFARNDGRGGVAAVGFLVDLGWGNWDTC